MRARDNPFSTDRVLKVRYRPQGESWGALMVRLASLRYRAAIVGPEGSGKTTLLEDLAPRLEAVGFAVRFVRLEPDGGSRSLGLDAGPVWGRGALVSGPSLESAAGNQRYFPPPSTGAKTHPPLCPRDIVLLDGADLLSAWRWFRLRRRLRAAGGLVITTHRPGRLPTLVECATSPELLDAIVRDLLGDAAEGWRSRLPALFAKHGGNLREALRKLYDEYAARTA
jgi:hypothetical protein